MLLIDFGVFEVKENQLQDYQSAVYVSQVIPDQWVP